MRRFSNLVLFALMLPILIGIPETARAQNDPDPNLSVVPKVLTMTPDGSYTITMVITGPLGPVSGSLVIIDIPPAAASLLTWADPTPPGADPPNFLSGGGVQFSKLSAGGLVSFTLAGAGCVADMIPGSPTRPYIAQVTASGVQMRECYFNNPDAVDTFGQLPESLGHDICQPYGVPGTSGSSGASLGDALYHTPFVKAGIPNLCTDFTAPYGDMISLADASFLTPYLKQGITCSCTTTF